MGISYQKEMTYPNLVIPIQIPMIFLLTIKFNVSAYTIVAEFL